MFTTTGEMKFKRISLNLIHYFQDHRQLSRICINDKIQTIGDLEKHIIKVFNIEKGFYLMCKNFFLPSTENICLLDDNDLIYVMPKFQMVECDVKLSKKSKNKYRSTEDIEVTEPSKAKKKKSAKNKDINVEINENDDVKIKDADPKKEVKKSKKNVDFNSQVNENIKMNLEVTENNQADKSNKSEDVTNMEVNESNGQTEIYDSFEERARKRRRCITPKKPNCRVSSEIFSLEHLNTVNQNVPTKELENEEMRATVQSVEVVNKEKQLLYNEQINNHLENRKSYALNEVIDFPCDKSPTKSFNGSRIKVFKQLKQYSGIGNVVKFLSADNSVNDESDDTVQSENNFVTKRRRIRTRRRKATNISQNETLNDSPVFPVFKPPKSIAAPKSHIKFANEEKENGLVHSTPKLVNNNVKTGDLNMNSLDKNSLSLVDVDPAKCIALSGVPNVNSVILFKKLKIGDNYTPVISNYILGKVTDVNENGQLSVHVLDGHDELKEPSGRFSCILEEDEEVLRSNHSSIILEQSTLIEPKLLTGISV